jgi:methylenetetrahydrofolate reductase (NADPH)
MSSPVTPAVPVTAVLAGFSSGVLGRDMGKLARSRALIPPGTRVHVGYQDSEDTSTRVGAARAIRQYGFVPVPIIAARRLVSAGMLREYLAGLQAAGASRSVLIVAGDPAQPRGPYPDAASVIGSGLLEEYGVQEVSVAGHPGGHPAVTDDALWQALAANAAALEQRGLDGGVVTQFGFDPARVLAWLAAVRARGLSLPVRVGVPGPARVRQLLTAASWCGVAVTEPVASGYGFSLADLTGTAGPDRFIRALASGYDPRLHGEVKLNFEPIGGIAATVEWVSRFSSLPG